MPTPKVTVHPVKVRKKRMYAVYRREGGKRKRSFFQSKAAADAQAEQLRDQISKAGEAWFSLPAPDRDRLMQAYALAKERGVDLNTILNGAQPTTEGPKLKEFIADLITTKENAGRADQYTKTLKTTLTQFAAGRSLTISQITLAHVESFLHSKSLPSRSTLRSRLSTMFKFAIRRGHRLDNPCARLEPVTVIREAPAVFTVPQAAKCLKWLKQHPEALPWFILSTLCALRPEEADKTSSAEINFKEGFVKVEAQTTKVRQRRIVYPKPEAMRLLKKSLKRGTIPITKVTRRRWIRKLRDHLGWKLWPKDITRHTAISYWLASGASVADVADMSGNSEKTLRKHYRAIVTRREAVKLWRQVSKLAPRS